jgi:integrase
VSATFHPHVCVRASGERLVVLLGPDGLADREGTLYCLLAKRLASGSHNSLLHDLQGVARFRGFIESRGIDWHQRVTSGVFLHLYEWSDFRSEVGVDVSQTTTADRLTSALSFAAWSMEIHADGLDDVAAREAYRFRAFRALSRYRKLIPRLEARQPRRELTPEQRILFARIIADPKQLERLWPDRFARVRNRLVLSWLLLLGHRSGELLSILMEDLHLAGSSPRLDVVRRHDSISDPRLLQPCVKGLGRRLAVPDTLMPALHEFLAARSDAQLSSPFLFITSSDRPMSQSTLTAIFKRLGEVFELLVGVTPHILRHTWVAVFRAVTKALKMRETDIFWIQGQAMGWADPERSNASYAPVERQEQVDRVSASLQVLMMGAPRG